MIRKQQLKKHSRDKAYIYSSMYCIHLKFTNAINNMTLLYYTLAGSLKIDNYTNKTGEELRDKFQDI